jgi:hypothetical protein
MTYDTEAYYERARSQSSKYTHIIYIPPMFAPQEDGFRWTDSDYQKQIDRMVRTTLYDWKLLDRTLMLKSEGVKERVAEVMDWLNG